VKISIIGTGQVGQALATALVAKEHDVVAGSRSPGAHTDFPSPVTSVTEAALDADVVINALPGMVALASFTEQGTDWLDGKVLLDAANAATPDGDLVYPNDSLAQRLQVAFPRSRVVKGLNTFNISVMTDPGVLGAPTSAYIAGDDTEAKDTVRELLVDLGWSRADVVDLGDLAAARALEHYFPMFLAQFRALGSPVFNVRLTSA
jgi:predicted dinucleotide-binding enzyme